MDVNNRSVFGAIAQAIKALMSLIIGISATAEEGVEIASSAVKAARERQAIDLTAVMKTYQTVSLKKHAVEADKAHEAVLAYVAGDPKRATRVDAMYVELDAAVNDELNRIRASRENR